MVISCVAFGCKNEQDYRRISFHGFPFKRPDILKLWIKAVRRKNWAPTKFSKLCGEHFLPTDYKVNPGCTPRFLKPEAVPTVFSYPKHLLPKIDEPRRKRRKELSVDVHNENFIEHTISPTDVNIASTSKSSEVRTLNDIESQNVSYKIKETLLVRKVKTLKQKVKRRRKEVIRSILRSEHSHENLDKVLKQYFEDLPLELVLIKKEKDEDIHSGYSDIHL